MKCGRKRGYLKPVRQYLYRCSKLTIATIKSTVWVQRVEKSRGRIIRMRSHRPVGRGPRRQEGTAVAADSNGALEEEAEEAGVGGGPVGDGRAPLEGDETRPPPLSRRARLKPRPPPRAFCLKKKKPSKTTAATHTTLRIQRSEGLGSIPGLAIVEGSAGARTGTSHPGPLETQEIRVARATKN